MSNSRNPSFGLTDAHVDDIVDRLLLGKYEKHRPVTSIEVVRAGLINATICRDLVVARWGQRSRWERGGSKDGPLSSAGVTMRSNKLWERCSEHVHAVRSGRVESDDLVWRITDARSYETVCFATGSMTSAKQWAHTLFGWTLRDGTRIDDLRSELAGCGGTLAASIANIGLLGGIEGNITDYKARAETMLAKAEKLQLLHDTISSAAAHLAGGTGATAD